MKVYLVRYAWCVLPLLPYLLSSHLVKKYHFGVHREAMSQCILYVTKLDTENRFPRKWVASSSAVHV